LIEPRQSGIRRVEVEFPEPIIVPRPASAVSITGLGAAGAVTPASLGITVHAAPVSDSLVITFSNAQGPCALPDACKWRFTLTPGEISGDSGSVLSASANTTRVISGLTGDITGNGRVTGIDVNRIANAGTFDPAMPERLRADVNGDGMISGADQTAAWNNRANRIDLLSNP
jgi:hypothetical protein